MYNERWEQIIAILQKDRFAKVSELCAKLFASPATVRRDLANLEMKGVLKRVRGGAEISGELQGEIPLPIRFQKEKEKKERIAAHANSIITKPATIFADSSSTVFYFIKQLSVLPKCTIITSGLVLLQYLSEATDANVYCTGGKLIHKSGFTGSTAIETAGKFCADYFIFSCCGYSMDSGATEADERNAAIKRAMFNNAKNKILLCDSGKYGYDYPFRTCLPHEITQVVSDI